MKGGEQEAEGRRQQAGEQRGREQAAEGRKQQAVGSKQEARVLGSKGEQMKWSDYAS